jgi:hypothetical protein
MDGFVFDVLFSASVLAVRFGDKKMGVQHLKQILNMKKRQPVAPLTESLSAPTKRQTDEKTKSSSEQAKEELARKKKIEPLIEQLHRPASTFLLGRLRWLRHYYSVLYHHEQPLLQNDATYHKYRQLAVNTEQKIEAWEAKQIAGQDEKRDRASRATMKRSADILTHAGHSVFFSSSLGLTVTCFSCFSFIVFRSQFFARL